jgi:hypothetical protein
MSTIPIGGRHTIRWGGDYDDILSGNAIISYRIGPFPNEWVMIDTVSNTVGQLNTYVWTNSFLTPVSEIYIRVMDSIIPEVYDISGPHNVRRRSASGSQSTHTGIAVTC